MAHVIENLVEQGSTSTGLTTVALTIDPRAPYRAFDAVMADGDTTEAMVVNYDLPTEWQAAVYSFAAGVLTFMRFIGSSTGSQIDFSAGLKRVYIAPLAKRGEWIVVEDDFVALPGDLIRANTTAGEIEITLPDSPADDAAPIFFTDQDGTWPTNNLVIVGDIVGGATSVRCADSADFFVRPSGGAWRVCL